MTKHNPVLDNPNESPGGSRLQGAVRAIMEDPDTRKRYPDGMNAVMMREELGDLFPLCTVIDIADEFQAIYGRPRP